MLQKTFQFCVFGIAIAVMILHGGSFGAVVYTGDATRERAMTGTGHNPDEKEIEWFRDQMQISEKYVEDHEGILGMSWAHFLSMVFLFLFALGALIILIQRQKRTREVVELIRKEIENGKSG